MFSSIPLKYGNVVTDDCYVSVGKGWVWFLFLMAYQLFLGYLMPKPFS